MATSNPTRDGLSKLFEGFTVYKNIGLDNQNRSHLYDPNEHEIVVCEGDVRGESVTDDDILQTIPANGKGAWAYVSFVRDEVDDTEWVDLDVPAEPPEEYR